MNSKINEILTITQEECAEVIQTISKIHRFGLGSAYLRSNTPINNIEALTQQIGDVLVMIDLLIEHNIITNDRLQLAKDAKISKLKKWSKIYE